MTNALVLDASPATDARATRAADAVESALAARGAHVGRLVLRTLSIRPCLGCFGCWTKRPGECLVADDGRRVAASMIAADVVAIVGPARFGTWNSIAKGALDRCIGLVLPHFTTIDGEIHHGARYPRYPRWIALGTMPAPDPGAAAIFHRLTGRNAINLHAPAFAAGVLAGSEDPAALASSLVAATEGVA